jgi:predicted nucleic acid-binding protein
VVTHYCDTSALVPLYLPERGSAGARRHAMRVGQIPYTQLHALELTNAIHLNCGRGIITAAELRAVTLHIDDDVHTHRLRETSLDLTRVFESATQLARHHSVPLLCRSLDLLHIAAALLLSCRELVSADDRQLALAKAVGLEAVPLSGRGLTPRRRT